MRETLLALGKECAELGRFWRNETGMALNIRTKEPFMYGLKGSADIMGIGPHGKLFCFEVKTGSAKQSSEQVRFEKMVKSFGGVYIVVRCVADAIDSVKYAL